MTSPTRPLGSSGLDITTVGFGAWSGGAEAGEPAERLYFQRRGLARASHRERSGISAGPRRCPIGPPAAVLQQWEHPMPSQRSDLQHSAVVVIDMANDFVYSGGVIADAGGPDYQERAQRLIAPLGRLLAAARRAGVTVVRSEEHTSELQSRLHLVCRLLLEKKTSFPAIRSASSGNDTVRAFAIAAAAPRTASAPPSTRILAAPRAAGSSPSSVSMTEAAGAT